jgi:hypothetical protein
MLPILIPCRMGLRLIIVGLVLVTGLRWEDEGT